MTDQEECEKKIKFRLDQYDFASICENTPRHSTPLQVLVEL